MCLKAKGEKDHLVERVSFGAVGGALRKSAKPERGGRDVHRYSWIPDLRVGLGLTISIEPNTYWKKFENRR